MTGSRLALGLLVLAAFACATAEPPSGIEDRDWYLVAVKERSLSVPQEASRPTLRLEKSRVAGFAGCNHFAGNYTLEGQELKFGPLASTKMFCQDTQAIEDAYLSALEGVSHWAIDGEQLALSNGDTVLLRFREMTQTRRVH